MILKSGFNLKYVQHMLHHSNLESILSNGILSHNEAYERELINKDISMAEVQERRANRKIKCGDCSHTLHDFVSFYFNAKNPMLYKRRNIQEELVVILINSNIINSNFNDNPFAIFSNGNAASKETKFFCGEKMLDNIDSTLIFADSWNSSDDPVLIENRRKRCSEVLVYPNVPVKNIEAIICPNKTMHNYVTNLKQSKSLFNSTAHINVEINRNYFF